MRKRPALALAALLPLAAPRTPGAADVALRTFSDVAAPAGIRFKHVNGSPEKNYIFEAKGGGVCVVDYDGDGRLDLYFGNGSTLEDVTRGVVHPSALYRARGDGTYEDVTSKTGTAGRGWGMGCTVGDYDDDGWPDLYVLGVNGNVTVLWPCMNCQMGFSNNYYTTYAKGIKFMEGVIKYCCLGFFCSGDEYLSYFLKALQSLGIAIPQFNKNTGT